MASSIPSTGMNWLPMPMTTTSITQHRCFKPTEDSQFCTHGVRTHHAIEQLLTMPAKDISDHRSFPFGCGLIHSIHEPW